MIDRLNPKSRRDAYGSRINRDHSPVLLYAVPYGTILLGSLVPILPVTGSIPLMPPLAFLFLLGWRLFRPGLLPVWAGFPLGIFDDLFSGQPFGSAILLFSATMLAIEALEMRFPWRSFWQDWVAATVAILFYLVATTMLSGADITSIALISLLPQAIVCIAVFPLVARLVAGLDRLRLFRIRVLG